MKYALNDIYPTVQGEGCQTGVAMVLVRLHGCGVGCPWCDTKETWALDGRHRVASIEDALGQNERWTIVSPERIVAHVKALHPGPRWILLTGGEPAEQELDDLVEGFHLCGYKVAIETSGTARGHVTAGADWVCVSPKIGMPGGKTIDLDAVRVAHEIKHVVGKPSDIDELLALLTAMHARFGTDWRLPEICLQPVSCSPKATELCTLEAIRRGWRLSVQTHKFAGIR